MCLFPLSPQLIWGFGHRVYRKGDPRSDIIKSCSFELTKTPTGKPQLFNISERIEKVRGEGGRKKTHAQATTRPHTCTHPSDLLLSHLCAPFLLVHGHREEDFS